MKKVFTFLASALLTMGAIAQQLPNGGFELWTNPTHPDMWGTYGNIFGFPGGGTYPYFATKDTTAGNFVEGTASLKMITDTVPAGPGMYMVVPSAVGLGALQYTTGHAIVASGIAYTKRIDTVFFSYKYSPARTTDTAALFFNLSKAGSSLFGGTLGLNLSATNTWRNVYTTITPKYSSNNNPDTLMIMFFSSRFSGMPADTGAFRSTLWIDAIHFNASVLVAAGIEELGTITGVNAYPNPTHDHINIAIEATEIGSQILLYDMQGREVYNGTLDRTTTAIDTKDFEAGMYAIKVNSIDHLTTYHGKISVTK